MMRQIKQIKRTIIKMAVMAAPLMGVGGGLGLTSCDSDTLSGDSYYTFTGETVASYIENRPDSFSVFTQIVKEAGEEHCCQPMGTIRPLYRQMRPFRPILQRMAFR